MTKYSVKIGSADANQWGDNIEAANFTALKAKVLNQIENLHPLNSSESGREEYRNRFRNQPIFAKIAYTETDYKELT